MTAWDVLHVAGVAGVAVVIAAGGRYVAGRARQPAVIGEITAGLLAGPAVIWLAGDDVFHTVFPAHVQSALGIVAKLGLALFLVGVAHELRPHHRFTSPALGWMTAGALLPALVAGALLAGWVLVAGDPLVRGTASAPAFVLMTAVSLSITAVPVLARILDDRGMTGTRIGQLALTAAIVIDAISWLLLTVAVGLASGRVDGFVRTALVLAVGAVAAWSMRSLARTAAASRVSGRWPVVAAIVIGGVAVGMAAGAEHFGMTAIFGAVLAGFAVPTGKEWEAPVAAVTAVGRHAVPVFFVATGITVFTKAFAAIPVTLVALAVVLGVAGKVAGGYAGARLGGLSKWDSMRAASLVNTRGLTELVVLQIGYSMGVLTAPMFLALVVMALVTTAMTGPILLVLDRAELRRRPPVQARQENRDGVL
ncbi:cation:proton antiporter [Lentzea sp. E54]|uniref:cation:proton antiporter n=1 Tax=Lentzea xerophila TaxID=3435883 RepID=UPI003DA50823